MTSQTDKVVKMPLNPEERRVRQLERLWAREDQLMEQLRAVQAEARKIAVDVSRDKGFMFGVSREVLQRAIRDCPKRPSGA